MAEQARGSLAALFRRLARAVSELASQPVGYRPGTPGDISTQIGYDVRDLLVAGYSRRQIDRVVDGEITLQQLLDSEPENKPR